MEKSSLINSIFHNKVFGYAVTRYAISALHFVTSMIIAVKLGSYLLGIWGFLLLLRRYFQVINLGVPDAITVFLVKLKDKNEDKISYESNALLITSFLSLLVLFVIILFKYAGIDVIDKYDLSWELWILGLIAILTLYNDVFFKIYRVEGCVNELTFYQSVIQILTFIVSLIFTGRILINFLLFSYLAGQIASMLVFIWRGYIHINLKTLNISIAKKIVNKAFFLFIYNFIFYLILLSTRSVVSSHYTVAEFGNFTFAYTLASAVITLIDAIASLVVPKIIDKYDTNDVSVINNTINVLRINYMHSAYILLEILLLGFTFVLFFLNSYSSTLSIVILMSLTVVLQTHAFPYTTFLMSKGKEKYLSFSSIIALIINIISTYFFISVVHTDYQYVIMGTWISYFIYSALNIFFTRHFLGEKTTIWSIVKECMPKELFIPMIFLFLAAIFKLWWIILVSMLICVVMNQRQVKVIFNYVIVLIRKPEIINIKK